MNAPAKLLTLYDEWRQWTIDEAEALDACDWPRAVRCQDAKASLQPLILDWSAAARKEIREQPAHGAAVEARLRSRLNELIQLESMNIERLSAERARIGAEQLEMEKSVKVIRQVRQTYSNAPQAAWQSYS